MKPRRRRGKAKRRSVASKAPRRKRRAPRAAATAVRNRSRSEDRRGIAELEREIRSLRSARSYLERRLTAAVQEIGMLRQFELRAQALETELASVRSERVGTRESALQ